MNKAAEFRAKGSLPDVSNVNPGWYRWYATREDLDFILGKLGSDFDSVKEFLLEKDGLYAIYVGIAAKESLHERINWHINDKHTLNSVESGALSTLRQAISSFISDQSDKKATDEFIDRLSFECFEVAGALKPELEAIENSQMAANLYIVNYMKNYHPAAKEIRKKLKAIRAKGKMEGLEKLLKQN